jgi:hypothetical protein
VEVLRFRPAKIPKKNRSSRTLVTTFFVALLAGVCTELSYVQNDVLDTGSSLQARRSNAPRESLVLSPVPPLIDQQGQAIQKAQLTRSLILFLSLQGFEQSLQLEVRELFHHWLLHFSLKRNDPLLLKVMAGTTRLELATFAVTVAAFGFTT